MKKYRITPTCSCVKDEASVDFHVKSDDYFGTIATVASLIRQDMDKDGYNTESTRAALKGLEKDLVYLQKNYYIIPKQKNRKSVPKGKLKSQ